MSIGAVETIGNTRILSALARVLTKSPAFALNAGS